MNKYGVLKFFLNLLIIACLVGIVWIGYLLFYTHEIEPILGIILFITSFGLLVWIPTRLNKHPLRNQTPSFKLVFFSLLGITLVLAFAGIQPLSTYKDTLISKVDFSCTPTRTVIPPGQAAEYDNWFISLDGGYWDKGTLFIDITIRNLGSRRPFGFYSLINVGPEIVAIDSTGKLVKPWVRPPDFSKWELMVLPSYTKEFYPGEKWSGTLKFELSIYSGDTYIYLTKFNHSFKHFLFTVWSPQGSD